LNYEVLPDCTRNAFGHWALPFGLGTKKIQGEFVNADDWNFPVDICVFAFKIPGLRILRQLGADVARLAEIFDHVIVPRTSKEHE